MTQASLQEELSGSYLSSIQSPYQEMIGNAVWHLGGSSTNDNVTASMFYERERGTTVYSGRPTEWIGKIALMYPSDYGYATSGGSTSNRTNCLNKELYNWDDSSYSYCKDNDWLFLYTQAQWTLTPRSDSLNSVFYVTGTGSVYDDYGDSPWMASPTLYLKSSVKISGGTGTSRDPFILSIE